MTSNASTPGRDSKHYTTNDLLRFIDLANLLPPDISLPAPWFVQPMGEHAVLLDTLVNRFQRRFPPRSDFGERVFEQAKWSGIERFMDFGPAVRTTWQPNDRYFLYELFYGVRRTLTKLIEASRKLPAEGEPDRLVDAGAISMAVTIAKDGTIERLDHLVYDGFLQSLVGKDVTRIRECPVCKKYFWASRKDKGACSPPCLNINRVNRSREKAKRRALGQARNSVTESV